MKKTLFYPHFILFFLFIFSFPLFSQETGDVNNDSDINIIDALLVAQFYVNLDPQNFNPGAADVNCDGSISIIDALLIAQYYVGLISGFSGCNLTPSPTSADCPIPCIATTVAPELTTDPAVTPTPKPVLTPGPTYIPTTGDVELNEFVFDSIQVCSNMSIKVYANTGYQSLSSFKITVAYTPLVIAPDECTGFHGVTSPIGGVELTVDAGTRGELVISGYSTAGMGPHQNLHILTIQFIAVDYGETVYYYGNSYFARGEFSITVQELLDINGEQVGYPRGVTYAGIMFYSGDFDPEEYAFPGY